MTHKIMVVYTNSDDGIWLECTCRWMGQVTAQPFFPSIEQLAELADEHLKLARA